MRRAVKRVGPVFCIAIVLAWGFSAVVRTRIGLGWGWEVSLDCGQAAVTSFIPNHRWRSPRGITMTQHSPELHWWFDYHEPPLAGTLRIPMWFVLSLAIVGTVVAWRLDDRARRRTDVCATCGYNRAGLAAGSRCPECGVGGQGAAIAGEA